MAIITTIETMVVVESSNNGRNSSFGSKH